MIPPPAKTAAKQVGLWVSLALLAALLTLLFSIVGTISLAALTGMVMGASRRWRWQTIPISLIFPLLGLALAQAAKADLTLHQRAGMPALCWGIFWTTYLLTLAVLCLEKKDAPPHGHASSNESQHLAEHATGDARPRAAAATALRLDDLQGTWRCATTGRTGKLRTIQFSENRVVLSVATSSGRAEVIAEGEIRVNGAEPVRTVPVLTDQTVI